MKYIRQERVRPTDENATTGGPTADWPLNIYGTQAPASTNISEFGGPAVMVLTRALTVKSGSRDGSSREK